MRVAALALAWSTAFVSGCGPAATFSCSEDEDCRDGDRIGTCEPDHYCSFPDQECPSGRRYGGLAAPELANECVASDGTTTDGGSSGVDTIADAEGTMSSTTPVSTSETASSSSSSGDDTGPIPTERWNP